MELKLMTDEEYDKLCDKIKEENDKKLKEFKEDISKFKLVEKTNGWPLYTKSVIRKNVLYIDPKDWETMIEREYISFDAEGKLSIDDSLVWQEYYKAIIEKLNKIIEVNGNIYFIGFIVDVDEGVIKKDIICPLIVTP